MNSALFTKCVYYIFKIIGLATINLDVTPSNENEIQRLTYAPSRYGTIYNLLLAISVIAINSFAVRASYEYYEFGNRSSFERTIDTIQIIFAVVSCLIILVTYCAKQREICEIGNELETLRKSLIEIGNVHIEPASIAYSTIKIFSANLATWLLLTCTTHSRETHLEANYLVTMYFIGVYVCEVIINYAVLQYSLVLKLIARLFESTNESLLRASEFESSAAIQPNRNDNPLPQRKLEEFKRLHNLHLDLCEIAEDTSDFYARPMLLCVSYTFVTLLVYAWYFAKPIVLGRFTLTTLQYVHCFFQLVHSIVLLIILASSVSEVTTENRRTRKIVNKWIANSDDELMIHKLKKLSTCLTQQSVEFTVLGLFSLDSSLLMSIAGSIATYLVILLQFQSSDSA